MPQPKTARVTRLEIRISPELKRRLEYAATLRGVLVAEFVVQTAQEAATRTIRENEVLTLSERARVPFAELLLNPPRPNRKAIAAARKFAATERKRAAEAKTSARQAMRPTPSNRATRNGVPLLPVRRNARRATSELVRQLQEELP